MIRTVREQVAEVIKDAIGIPHVTPYRPNPVVRPSVWVDSWRVEAGGTSTWKAPGLVLDVIFAADGDSDAMRRSLDEYIEIAWFALSASRQFGLVSAEPLSLDDAVAYPGYRITVIAWTSL